MGRHFPTPIIAGPQTSVFFRLTIDNGVTDGAACRETSYLEITAPADTVPVKLPLRAAYCGKASVLPLSAGIPVFRGK